MTKTGETPLHPYFNKSRAYAMLKEQQRLRNLHRHNIKYDNAMIEDFANRAEEMSVYYTHEHFEAFEEYKQNKAAFNTLEDHLNSLPDNLKKELTSNKEYLYPKNLQFINYYWGQVVRMLPQQFTHIYKAGQKLRVIFENDLEFHDE